MRETKRETGESGGSRDEEEEASDVIAKKRAKVIAKNQVIRAQERVWEAARVQQQAKIAKVINADKTDDEKLAEYKQTASYQERQESYAVYYAQKEKEEQAEANRQALIAKNEDPSPLDMAKVNQLVQNSVDAARWTGVASVAQAKQEEKPNFFEGVISWVDQNQLETSIGVGAVVGLAAIAITLAVASAVTLPVILLAAGVAAIASSVVVASGTVALNSHYDRPVTENILENVKAAAITAAVVSGIGLFITGGLLTQAVIATGNAVAGTCAANPSLCANAGTIMNVIDTLEQAALTVQLEIETTLVHKRIDKKGRDRVILVYA